MTGAARSTADLPTSSGDGLPSRGDWKGLEGWGRRVASVIARRPPDVTWEDAVQDAVVVILTVLDRMAAGRANVPADVSQAQYLFVRAAGDLRDKYGKVWKHLIKGPAFVSFEDARVGPFDPADPAAPPSVTAEESLDIQDALEAIPPSHRAVAHAYYFQGYPIAKIASMRGVSQPAVSKMLEAARDGIARYLSN